MLYAILAYHVEKDIAALTPQEDAALMADLIRTNDRLNERGTLGPAGRLDATQLACTLRGGLVLDGPFAETKEQLLGFYVVDCPTRDAAIDSARDLSRVNPTAVYEIRPVSFYLPGATIHDGSGADSA